MKVYIVYENITNNYIPKPYDWTSKLNLKTPNWTSKLNPIIPDWTNPLSTNFIESPIIESFNSNNPLKPHFDQINPKFLQEPSTNNNLQNIICVCKDLITANNYINGHNNRFILGPYNII